MGARAWHFPSGLFLEVCRHCSALWMPMAASLLGAEVYCRSEWLRKMPGLPLHWPLQLLLVSEVPEPGHPEGPPSSGGPSLPLNGPGTGLMAGWAQCTLYGRDEAALAPEDSSRLSCRREVHGLAWRLLQRSLWPCLADDPRPSSTDSILGKSSLPVSQKLDPNRTI